MSIESAEASNRDADGAESSPVTVDVRRGAPTEAELAAVVAVVTESYEREASAAVVDESARRSPWEINARALRQPLRRDIGWGRFGG